MLAARHFLLLFASLPVFATQADRAVMTVMRSVGVESADTKIVNRVPVAADLDLVVAIGWERSAENPNHSGRVNEEWLGILLQRHHQLRTVYKVALTKIDECDTPHIDRITIREVVLSCLEEKGLPGPSHKFIYDLRSNS